MIVKLPAVFDNPNMPDGDISKIAERSKDNAAMMPYWQMVRTITKGIRAMREARETYLPKFPHESAPDYDYRVKTATMTNVYRDIVEGLAGKPFAEPATVKDGGNDIETLAEDIDGRGNALSVFLYETMFAGINDALSWILIDYPTVDGDRIRTVAEERAANIRPYWVRIPAINMLEVRSQNINGISKIVYVRMLEKHDDGDRVRVFDSRFDNKTNWRLYKEEPQTGWILEKQGIISINVIPLVPYITGRRDGASWQFDPVMRDAADLQVELYQQESEKKQARTQTCFPMLAANGVKPDYIGTGENRKPKPVPVGPLAVLYAPPNDDGGNGEWKRISADAEAMAFLQSDVKETISQMREIGRLPLTAQSGNITRIDAKMAATKANSAVQAWAFALRDAAEQAFKITAMWLGQSVEPSVEIYTDFETESDENDTPKQLTDMRKNGDLSRKTYWQEMKRQGVLSATFDPEIEQQNLIEEYGDGSPDMNDVDDAMSDVDN